MEKIKLAEVLATGRHYFKMKDGKLSPFDSNGVEGDTFFGMCSKKFKMTPRKDVIFTDTKDMISYIGGLVDLLNTLQTASIGEGNIIATENEYVLIIECVEGGNMNFVIWYNVELKNPHIKYINEYYNIR